MVFNNNLEVVLNRNELEVNPITQELDLIVNSNVIATPFKTSNQPPIPNDQGTIRIWIDLNNDGEYQQVDWTAPGAVGGEVNELFLVGTGLDISLPKITTDLPIKGLIAEDTKLTITDDAINNNLVFGLGAVNLADLANVDPTISASNTPSLRVLADIDTDGNFTYIDWTPPAAGGGEINNGVNIGIGAQIFAGKTGVNLEFRSLQSTSEIVATQNTNDITFAIANNAITTDKVLDSSITNPKIADGSIENSKFSQKNGPIFLGRIAGNGGVENINMVDARTMLELDTRIAAGVGLVEPIDGLLPTVEDKEYVISLEAIYAYQVNRIVVQTVSGTFNLSVQIDGVNITGLGLISVSSTKSAVIATGNNNVAIGQKLSFLVSSASSPVDFSFTLTTTKT